MPFGNRKKNILEDFFSSVLSQFEKYHPFGNLKFNNLGFLQSSKLRILAEKILLISLRLYFTPNAQACLWVKIGKHRHVNPRFLLK